MNIEYSNGQCGSGKTYWAVTEMATKPTRYVYCVDRVEEFATRAKNIRKAADKAGLPHPFIHQVYSGPEGTDSVKRDIEDLAERFRHYDHVVVIITHSGLKMASHRNMVGWTCIIDEDISTFKSATWKTPVSGKHLSEAFDLVPVGGVSQIVPKSSADDEATYHKDNLLKEVASFRSAMETRSVLTDLESWTPAILGEQWLWWTTWSFTELNSYDRVVVLANAWEDTLSYKLATDVNWVPVSITGPRTARPDVNVRITYFADDHRSGSDFFKTDEGRDGLRKIAAWINENTPTDQKHYYCTNTATADVMTIKHGTKISPKIAGSNEYMDHTICSAIYAAKASPNEARALKKLTNGRIGSDDVQRSRELEDLAQIVLRSTLRDPESTAAVSVRVYDHEQAKFLAGFLVRNGYCLDVEMDYQDLGLSKTTKKIGRPVTGKAMTQAERNRKSYEKRKLMKKKGLI